jgi:hypothetical protein
LGSFALLRVIDTVRFKSSETLPSRRMQTYSAIVQPLCHTCAASALPLHPREKITGNLFFI